MPTHPDRGMSHGEKAFSPKEIEEIIETVTCFANLPRRELIETICEHVDWYAPTGSYRTQACEKFLVRLEKEGYFTLPPRKKQVGPRKPTKPMESEALEDTPQAVRGDLKEVGGVDLEVVESTSSKREWIGLVSRYHYLGYRKPFGCVIRYFIVSRRGVLGCVQCAGAAKAVAVRDRWIGWDVSHKRRNRGWVINNNRFLILPWVTVKNLASHVLGRLSRRVGADWERLWGYRPVLLETFVDPDRYHGSSYRGAGWTYLGLTSGEGLVRPGKEYTTRPKMVFVYPLQSDCRELLCSSTLMGRVPE